MQKPPWLSLLNINRNRLGEVYISPQLLGLRSTVVVIVPGTVEPLGPQVNCSGHSPRYGGATRQGPQSGGVRKINRTLQPASFMLDCIVWYKECKKPDWQLLCTALQSPVCASIRTRSILYLWFPNIFCSTKGANYTGSIDTFKSINAICFAHTTCDYDFMFDQAANDLQIPTHTQRNFSARTLLFPPQVEKHTHTIICCM